MIAYNREQLENLRIRKFAQSLKDKNVINKITLENIKDAYKVDFYMPDIFIRIALFIFTAIIIAAGLGLILLGSIIPSGEEVPAAVFCILYGLTINYVLERIYILAKKNYRSGIDDALTYAALGLIITGLWILLDKIFQISYENEELLIYTTALPFIIAAAIRYTDRLLTVLAFLFLGNIMFILLLKCGPVIRQLLPFIVMLLSTGSYLFIKKLLKKDQLTDWSEQFHLLEILSLLCIYFSVNYFVVRELSQELLGLRLEEGQDIPLAILFYFLTISIPLYYIIKGLKDKNRIMFRTGLLILVATVLTFKYYYSTGHHEITLTVSGLLMIALAWYFIRYLKTPKHGFTMDEDKGISSINTNLESVIITESLGSEPAAAQNGVKFGDGEFGGGGAGAGY
jgi:hypothetical protein